MAMTEDQLNERIDVEIVTLNGQIRCVYVNDFRLAGGKPWGGGQAIKNWRIPVRDLLRALPPDIRQSIGVDYLGNLAKKQTD